MITAHSLTAHSGDEERVKMDKLTHVNENGEAVMVDISDKSETKRCARACGKIKMTEQAYEAVCQNKVPKGDVIAAARIAGIMAVKKTPDIIPLCHTLLLDGVAVDFEFDENERSIKAVCTVNLTGKTGAEMEALTGVSVSLLTVYDMCKAVDKEMEITDIHLLEKTGGKSGHFINTKGEI